MGIWYNLTRRIFKENVFEFVKDRKIFQKYIKRNKISIHELVGLSLKMLKSMELYIEKPKSNFLMQVAKDKESERKK